MKFFKVAAVVVALMGGASQADAAVVNLISNGDFSNGTTGWSISNVSNHYDGIANVDIDGLGPLGASDAYYAQTGGGFGTSSVTISQILNVVAGETYSFAADIASYASGATNSSGGVFTASIGGTQLDTHNFGSITGSTYEYASLSGSFTASVTSALTFAIELFRPYTAGDSFGKTPFLYVDNVDFSGEANIAQTPLPAGVWLFGSALAGLGVMQRRKKKSS